MRISECVDFFISYIEDKSPNTVKNYKIDLNQFKEILKDKEVENITKADIARFRMYLQSKKLKSSTVARKIASINSFFRYLIDMDIINSSPITKSHRPKIANKIPEALTHEEVKKLIDNTDNLMDKVLIILLIATGLRASELLGIKRADIIVERDENLYTIDSVIDNIQKNDIAFIKVLGKGNKERLVPITGKALILFAEYLKKHRFDMVFPLSYTALWKRIKI
jgi:integrase/recombinase XerD